MEQIRRTPSMLTDDEKRAFAAEYTNPDRTEPKGDWELTAARRAEAVAVSTFEAVCA